MKLASLGLWFAHVVTAAAAEDGAAVKRTGESRHPQAPLFRTLAKRYPIAFLEEALGEGIISGHPDRSSHLRPMHPVCRAACALINRLCRSLRATALKNHHVGAK